MKKKIGHLAPTWLWRPQHGPLEPIAERAVSEERTATAKNPESPGERSGGAVLAAAPARARPTL